MITSRANRSGISVAIGKPSSPPQSWQTSVIRFRSSCLMNDSQRVVMQRVGVRLASDRLVRPAKADQVDARSRGRACASVGTILRYK